MMNKLTIGLLSLTFFLYSSVSGDVPPKHLRLFVIGNSFSQNSTKYLSKLAAEAGHTLTIGRAERSGCSLQQHWESLDSALKNPAHGKSYKGKSLIELLKAGEWDVVTMQQASIFSANVETYSPYAKNLQQFIRNLQPKAELVMNKTWAYRSDAPYFGKINNTDAAKTDEEIFLNLSNAYAQTAANLGLSIIPTGDAFWQITKDPNWTFQPDHSFNVKDAVYPQLPAEKNSLHAGYSWVNEKLKFDTHHASNAGCFLASLVWYSFLFKESPEKLSYVPEGISADFATVLKKKAWEVVNQKNIAVQSPDYLGALKTRMSTFTTKSDNINLVFHGHSVPSGYWAQSLIHTFESYPNLLLKKLNAKYPKAIMNVILTSRGSETAETGQLRFEKDVLIHRPDVIFIDYALNDMGTGLKRALVAWEKMITAALAKNIKVVLITPSPDQRENLKDPNNRLAQHAAQIRKLAEKYKVGLADPYAEFEKIAVKDGSIVPYMASVNHPNEKGHTIIVEQLFNWFK